MSKNLENYTSLGTKWNLQKTPGATCKTGFCYVLKNVNDYLLSGRPLLGSFLLEQIVIKQITQ